MSDVERVPVESSNIESIGYDEETKELVVEFKGGQLYLYENVPPLIYKKFLEAESKGRFFGANIKQVFGYRKVEEEKKEKQSEKPAPVQEDKSKEFIQREGGPEGLVLVWSEIDNLKNRVVELERLNSELSEELKNLRAGKTTTNRSSFGGKVVTGSGR